MAELRFASLEDVERQIQEWPEEFRSCRSFSHQWKMTQRTRYPQGFLYVVFACPRCKLLKKMEMSPVTGKVYGKPWYAYPEGYLAKDLGRMGVDARNMIRAAAILGPGPDLVVVGAADALDYKPREATLRALAEED